MTVIAFSIKIKINTLSNNNLKILLMNWGKIMNYINNDIFYASNYVHKNDIAYPNNNNGYELSVKVLLFFTLSFLGWVWEVLLLTLNNGIITNRGVMHGCWLPIYGTAGLFVLTFLKKYKDKPILFFIATTLSCGIIEYFTSFFLEKLFDASWWDYSNEFLNLHGRVYLLGLIFFGIIGYFVSYIFAPFLNSKLLKIPKKIRLVICILLILLFIFDMIFSYQNPNMGQGISYSVL